MRNGSKRLQSSFELLVTLAFGLAILLPLVIIAFIQLASTNTNLSAIQSQQAASKLASTATLIGSQGPPAKQLVQIQVPPNVRFIYVGNVNNTIGHEVIFVITSPSGLSYITAYTPVNVSGSLGGITSTGTYLVNVTSVASCPSNNAVPCVYLTPKV
ncbi:MAG: hypothetical protein KGI04_01030 [Candidatus Micrarchaeota archaeon]|nr:hypothetical protein [Candidatus Micrarchaeota archaeon]